MGKVSRFDIKGLFTKEEEALIDFKVDFKEHKAVKVLKRSTSQRPDKCMPRKDLTFKPLKRPDEDEEQPEDATDKLGGAEAIEQFKQEVKQWKAENPYSMFAALAGMT